MKKTLLKRYNESIEADTEPPVKRMKTRSMTKKEESASFDKTEYEKYHNNREEYDKEQERRRLAGIKPVIICMGGPYSDAWYPPHN